MKTLISTVDVVSKNGMYRFYQYKDGNPLLQVEIYKIEKDREIKINNVLRETKKLNDEFGFGIEYSPKNRKHPLNTREFSDKFIRRYREI